MLGVFKYQKFIEKSETEQLKTMYIYALLKRFNNNLRLQFYMYAFMYVDPETMPVENYITATKQFFEN